MRINIPSEEDGFKKYEHVFCNIPAYLIIPEVDAKWNKNNLHFRSLIVDKDGYVLSSGFPKFFNLGEKPDCYPDPDKFTWYIEEKIDGSLVICDYVNGCFNMRTRGTASYLSQENSKDFELLPQRYPKILEYFPFDPRLSLLFEIVTPNNVIVIRPQDVEFYFLGAVDKDTLKMLPLAACEEIRKIIGNPPEPKYYKFEDNQSLLEIAKLIKEWKGKEGVVVSYNNNQNKIKIKSDWYCLLHKIKSQLSSDNNLIEYYVDNDMPNYQDFYNIIEKNFDYEIAEQLSPQILKLVEANNKVKKILKKMKEFVLVIQKYKTRKEQAEAILQDYKSTHTSLVFNLLDNKEIVKKQYVNLIKECF